MRDSRKKKNRFTLAIVLLTFAFLAAAFFLRPPALIVTDASFRELYGSLRLKMKQAGASLKLYRRVIAVPVAESAGNDLIVFAVEEASRAPGAVLFPYRYLEAAGVYGEGHPGARVLVMGGRNPAPRGGDAFTFIGTDTATDVYRAGLCAALFSGAAEGGSGAGKRTLFFTDGTLAPRYREIFREGLRAGGVTSEPVFAGASDGYSAFSDIGCVVVAGPAQDFPERNLDIPMILFSWVDPALCPGAVKIVFDDSCWALAAAAVSGSGTTADGETFLPSESEILKDRIEKKDLRTIQRFVKEKFDEK